MIGDTIPLAKKSPTTTFGKRRRGALRPSHRFDRLPARTNREPFSIGRSEDAYTAPNPSDLTDLLEGAGRHDQAAVFGRERWLRARGYDDEADRVA